MDRIRVALGAARAWWRRPLAPLIAIVLAAAEIAALFATWRGAFGGAHALDHRISFGLAHAILIVGGGATGVVALAGIHRALAGFRPLAAALACVALWPCVVIGLGSVYGSLLLAGIV